MRRSWGGGKKQASKKSTPVEPRADSSDDGDTEFNTRELLASRYSSAEVGSQSNQKTPSPPNPKSPEVEYYALYGIGGAYDGFTSKPIVLDLNERTGTLSFARASVSATGGLGFHRGVVSGELVTRLGLTKIDGNQVFTHDSFRTFIPHDLLTGRGPVPSGEIGARLYYKIKGANFNLEAALQYQGLIKDDGKVSLFEPNNTHLEMDLGLRIAAGISIPIGS